MIVSHIESAERNSKADRQRPEWAKPLAPLPDWLRKVDSVLQEAREPARVVHLRSRPRPSRSQNPPAPEYCPLVAGRRARNVRQWRRELGLTPHRMARLLGYASAADIRTIEGGQHVPRSTQRQRALAERRCLEAAADRGARLAGWRHRLGLTQEKAAQILGYTHRRSLGCVEAGCDVPSWERLLAAIELEKTLGRAGP